jgi:hypothetical protein
MSTKENFQSQIHGAQSLTNYAKGLRKFATSPKIASEKQLQSPYMQVNHHTRKPIAIQSPIANTRYSEEIAQETTVHTTTEFNYSKFMITAKD